MLAGASAYRLWRRAEETEFFSRSLRTGVLAAALGITVTVAFGYAQFDGIAEGKFGNGNVPASAALGFMIETGQLLALVVLLVMLPLIRVLPRARWAHPVLMLMTPLPFVLAISGWLARELGRQPWMIWERLTIADAMTPGLTAGMVTTSLIGFTAVLGLLAVVDYVLIARAIRRGPQAPALGAASESTPSPALTY
ncbi:cytochrome ubiquinol oxidase subunit I [Nonomuraea sp. NPDC049309]|uniref:cytochrome ubiquinol oxidase subunit I n=1 Tax=Nonomuraea sp. NPDC049309 TaxID=3364350 RepID=UPI003716740E